jgi:hypothetical protein
MDCPFSAPPGLPGGFQGNAAGSIPPYPPAGPVMNGGYGPSNRHGIPRGPPAQANVQQQGTPMWSRDIPIGTCVTLANLTWLMTTRACHAPLTFVRHCTNFFNCQNAQQYIDTRNRHKTQFPAPMSQLGAANRNIALKCVNPFYVNTTDSPYPTRFCMSATTFDLDDDDITIPTSNVSLHSSSSYKLHALTHILAKTEFAGAAFCLNTKDVIADSGATQIFVMEGACPPQSSHG